MANPLFWCDKSVLMTGHSGFKGAWAARWLSLLGAKVTGVALKPETKPNLFTLVGIEEDVNSHFADIRDPDQLAKIVNAAQPQIIIHLAAQALVRRSYDEPLATFASNIMGTAHLLDAARHTADLETILIITSDKVYKHGEQNRPFREDDRLGGHDPYSASKAAAELVTASYAASFFHDSPLKIATARGGNVIGGGDFSTDRIVPDIWRAAQESKTLTLRYPDATRPWQHVLDCLNGYFLYIEKLSEDTAGGLPKSLNFGPSGATSLSVAELTEAMQKALDAPLGWQRETGFPRKEMSALSLDTSQARKALCWYDRLPGHQALDWTAKWYQALGTGTDMNTFTKQQIASFMERP